MIDKKKTSCARVNNKTERRRDEKIRFDAIEQFVCSVVDILTTYKHVHIRISDRWMTNRAVSASLGANPDDQISVSFHGIIII